MKTVEQAKTHVGVIVGRFQVDDLHGAHTALIEDVRAHHKKVLIFIGVSSILGGTVDPLDFPTRAAMILHHYPDVVVLPIHDVHSDDEWSRNLDQTIRVVCPVGQPLLYGGRDSFVRHYTGKFPTVELDAQRHPSGTEIREEVGREVRASSDFRAGVIYSTFNQYARLHMVVDIATVRMDVDQPEGAVLLAKKVGETCYRFPGGFVDANDPSLEAAARRECKEETCVFPEVLEYLGSFRIPDRRMGPRDKMLSAFFLGRLIQGADLAKAQDDVDEVAWIPVKNLRMIEKYQDHWPLFDALMKRLGV